MNFGMAGMTDGSTWRCLTFAALLSLGACEAPPPTAGSSAGEKPSALPTGYWQASITLPGGDIETGFEIGRVDNRYQASLINGQERVKIDEVRFDGDELLLRFPAFNNEIRATLSDGELAGTLTLMKRFGDTQVMPFVARQGTPQGAEGTASPNHDLSGRWAVSFQDADGIVSPAIGEFAQRGSRLFGTFLTPDSDYRYLAGHVRGDQFHLSTFDGAHAFVFAGKIGAGGGIDDADFWSGTSSHQVWSAERNENVKLPDAFSRTYLKPGYERFEFAFPDQDGNSVTLDDEKYRGKVVLVTIAGTWCPNCNDEARFLAPLYLQHRGRGLEIVALLFEHFDEFDVAAEQVRAFRDKFSLQYDTLIAGVSDKTEASRTLPALNAVLAFPTTLFIDRSGRVRHIYTGFSGPGTGEHYVRLQNNFREIITDLLDEPPNLIESLTDANKPEAQAAQ
jgi:peroxiredoxin